MLRVLAASSVGDGRGEVAGEGARPVLSKSWPKAGLGGMESSGRVGRED